MPNPIRRLLHRLALLLAPGTGAHRAGAPRHRAPRPSRRAPHLTAAPAARLLLDGAASRLVRPYLTAYEVQEQQRQQYRRRALVLAADFGIDLDQHLVGAPQGTVAA
ncbi:hypothetical protein [Streptomyces olivaceus]|uniref:hypothetical protein n=1 Tax=Streptomyces olivaceus TaxID=47716 RepID=UPI0018853A5C|nr:hypothetical protein [Streptomyces olivaceus]